MFPNDKDSYKRHISTHSKYSVEDHAAVSTLNDFLFLAEKSILIFLFNKKLRFLLNKNAPQGGALRAEENGC